MPLLRFLCLYVSQLTLFFCGTLYAQDLPTAEPVLRLIDEQGETESTSYNGGAPLHCRFEARPINLGLYTPRYEWRFKRNNEVFLTRFEENTSFDFLQSGNYQIELWISFVTDTDTLIYQQAQPFLIEISESKLEFPNAFTPNGDGINDVLQAKEGTQSIVRFQARIFNRGGKQLYEWHKVNEGWDGRFNGREVPDGAYYLQVEAQGADGKRYEIKKTITLLRKFNSSVTGF